MDDHLNGEFVLIARRARWTRHKIPTVAVPVDTILTRVCAPSQTAKFVLSFLPKLI